MGAAGSSSCATSACLSPHSRNVSPDQPQPGAGRAREQTETANTKLSKARLTTGTSRPLAPGSDRAPSQTSGVFARDVFFMQGGEVCGRLFLLLSMSAGYKLSIMKGKETRGTRQGLQARPAPPHSNSETKHTQAILYQMVTENY